MDKFLLLMWKNWRLQYRKPVQTVVEIIAPVLFSILLVLLRGVLDPKEYPDTTFEPFCVLPFHCPIGNNGSVPDPNFTLTGLEKIELVYSPATNTALKRSMVVLKGIFGDVIGYDNSQQLEAHFVVTNATMTLAGIQFADSLANQDVLPDNLEVSIRFPSELRSSSQNSWRTNTLYPVYQPPEEPNNHTGAIPRYFDEGFLMLQMVLTYVLAISGYSEVATFEELSGKLLSLLLPMIQMKRFPYASWINDVLLKTLEYFVGMIILLSFVYTCINTVQVITTEKEKQLKEAMKIMGLPNWLHWTAWFVKSFVFLLISVVLIVMVLKIPWNPDTDYSVFTYSDPTVILVFMMLYMCATITFCFAVSVFFSKANTAAAVAGLIWFVSYSPYLYVAPWYDTLTISTKLLLSFASNTAMALGFQLMVMYEGTNEGIQWSNIASPITSDDSLTLQHIMMMLIVDTFLYLIIALYVEGVFPGEYGVPLPWNFPFTASYWRGRSRYNRNENFSTTSTNEGEFFEKDPSNLAPGIQIKNLRKVFGTKAAVRNLSLNMYNDEITVLLGPNGAGKTTTMSMLTGMLPPTSGTAIINGHDITTDMNAVRASLGLCPQRNILFDDLTVTEHLYFFSRLKGLKKQAINKEIDKYVELLELQPKANTKSSTLSGGMKRKLCVGMALCGKSKVVMLDEPTAGMDPSARRALWDLLQKQKHGRTILLMTHFMDEADLLADRIAIMAAGELQCCGSSFFLKKKYGAGYHLILDKSPSCQVEEVTRLLQKHIPNIHIHGNVGSELTYLLAENQSSVFEKMLQDLEQQSDKLGIRSYGISLTTLEEVFMKVGADLGQEENYNLSHPEDVPDAKRFWHRIKYKLKSFKNVKIHSESQETAITMENIVLLTGLQLIKNQFLAMLMKKTTCVIRTYVLQFVQILIPVVFLVMTITVVRNSNRLGDLPSLPITLDTYDNPVTLVEELASSNYSQMYLATLQGHEVQIVDNITSTMLKLTETIPATVGRRYIVGATFDATHEGLITVITAWFNNNPFHSPPLALGLVLNLIFKEIVGDQSSISFVNHPLPYTTESKIQRLQGGSGMGLQVAVNMGFSMAFVSSFYVLFYVKERVCKSKHLQFVSGVKIFIFWMVSFLCDLVTFIVTIIAIIIILICFQEEGFRSADELGRLFLILFYFGCCMLPVMYLSSYFFDFPSTGYTRMTLFNVFTGVGAFFVINILLLPVFNLEYIGNNLHWILLAFPHYSLVRGIRDSFITFATNKMCKFLVKTCIEHTPGMTENACWDRACHQNQIEAIKDNCCVREPDYFKWETPGIGRNFTYSFLVGLLLFVTLILIDYKPFSKIINQPVKTYHKKGPEKVPNEDHDVKAEKDMIHNTPDAQLQKDYVLVLKDLTKYYKRLLAVNGLCLGVKQFECFGLLGLNGAGKTTTFKMITGDVKTSFGEAWVKGYSIKTQVKEVQKLIGYCPQFDALLDDLTAKETLTMFALLRGVPLKDCKYLADKLARDFDFHQHLDKKVKELSGGNKRKLSTLIALVGDPAVIYLDEPTAGVDPATKRYLWDALCKVRDEGKCVVLTSHSMEECEALCTRIAIMVNGNFKCLGSTQHLKNMFAEGCTLTIKIKKYPRGFEDDADTTEIEDFVARNFPKAKQREKHQELLTYYIVDTSIPWSRMFGILEEGKKQLNIEDYSLGQSSLEQIFLTFTKLQR